MRGKRLLVVGIVLVLAVGAGSIAVLLRSRAKPPAPAPASMAPAEGPVLSLPAVIEAVEAVDVPVVVPGKIVSMPVQVGDLVAEGQLLAEIRSSEMESRICCSVR